MRIVFSVLLLPVALSCFSQDPTPHQFTLVPKEFTTYGFVISLPQEWNHLNGSKVMKNKILKSIHRVPGENLNRAAVSLTFEHVDADMPHDSVFMNAKRNLLGPHALNQIIDCPASSIDGRPTRTFQYTYYVGSYSVTSISTFFIEKNILFWFNATAQSNEIELYRSLFRDIASSIRLMTVDVSQFEKEGE